MFAPIRVQQIRLRSTEGNPVQTELDHVTLKSLRIHSKAETFISTITPSVGLSETKRLKIDSFEKVYRLFFHSNQNFEKILKYVDENFS